MLRLPLLVLALSVAAWAKVERWNKIVEKVEEWVPPPQPAKDDCYPYSLVDNCVPKGWDALAQKVAPTLIHSHDDKVTMFAAHGTDDDMLGFIFARDQNGRIVHLREFSTVVADGFCADHHLPCNPSCHAPDKTEQ